MQDNQYLLLMALVPTKSSLLDDCLRFAAQYECQLVHSHIQAQNEQLSLNFVFGGAWSAIAKLETALNKLAQQQGQSFLVQRTQLEHSFKPVLSYLLYVTTTADNPNIYALLDFLRKENLELQELASDSYRTRYTQQAMISLTFRVSLPIETSIAEWRERFILFCDDLNLDAVMEPEK